jgi:hypothetical protein
MTYFAGLDVSVRETSDQEPADERHLEKRPNSLKSRCNTPLPAR